MNTIADAAKSIPLLLNRRIPYLFTLKNVLLISVILGGIQVFVTIFLEPHNTGSYQGPYRNFRLAGYALCFVFPFLIIYSIEKWIYKLQDRAWKVYQEIISKFLLVVLISTASYFYNITVINSISPSYDRWIEHMIVFGLPYVPLFVPFVIIIYAILYRFHSEDEKPIVIKGQNQDDILKITESQFIYAESDQNYVTIFFKQGETVEKKLMRSSLQAIEDQLNFVARIHQSYLINPSYLKTIDGNKRKRAAILNYIDINLPVSVNFNETTLNEGS